MARNRFRLLEHDAADESNVKLKPGACGCTLRVGGVSRGEDSFPFSPQGWHDARERARAMAQVGLSMVDVVCDDGRMPLYQCSEYKHADGNYYVSCNIEGFSGRPQGPLAAARRRGRKRR
jgi:hypothetical protein